MALKIVLFYFANDFSF
jgi:hypothetical protein